MPQAQADKRSREALNRFVAGESTHISHLTSRTLVCDLRHALEKQGYSAKSCQADRGTQWVTPKRTICGSVLTVV